MMGLSVLVTVLYISQHYINNAETMLLSCVTVLLGYLDLMRNVQSYVQLSNVQKITPTVILLNAIASNLAAIFSNKINAFQQSSEQ